MEIRNKKGSEMTIDIMDAGDVFWHVDEHYIKTDSHDGDYIKAVCLSDGTIGLFEEDTTVEYISGFFQVD